MIDLDRVKRDADLLALIGRDTQLRKAASTRGGEWAGPCVFCGGRDRMRVQPNAQPYPLWMCRQCTDGKWDTAIGYIARRDELDPKKRADLEEISRRIVGNVPTAADIHRETQPLEAYAPPAADWQAEAGKIIEICKNNLWSVAGQKALRYLKKRGLAEKTIADFNLGYSGGFKLGNLWVTEGILIPCAVAGEVWYLKIRRPVPSTSKDKYICVAGSRTAAIFNADSLAGSSSAVWCEGEFDCMIFQQETGGIVPCVTLGSATNLPDLASWGAYLLPLRVILSAYDQDRAGASGAARLKALAGSRVKAITLPAGHKDINDYFLAGGNLWEWIKSYLEHYDSAPAESILDAALQLGGEIVDISN